MNILHLERNQAGRRTGLTRGAYRGGRLLRTIAVPALAAQSSMESKSTSRATSLDKTVGREEDEEHIFRPPQSLSDSEDEVNRIVNRPSDHSDSSGDERARINEANIKSTNFRTTTTNERGKDLTRGSTLRTFIKDSSTTTRSTRQKGSSLSRGSSSPKRKITEESSNARATKTDIFGNVEPKKKKKKRASTVYGSSQSNKPSSSIASTTTIQTQVTPKKEFSRVIVKSPGDSDSDNERPLFQKVDTSALDETRTTTPPKPGFRASKIADSPPSYRKIRLDPQVSRLLEEDQEEKSNFRLLGLDGAFDTSDLPASPVLEEAIDISIMATQREPFRKYDLSRHTESIEYQPGEHSDDFDQSFLSAHQTDTSGMHMQQAATCPMCKQPVDLKDLMDYGNMNTRLQEEFCRTHQKKTAHKEWDSKGYPEIDWAKMESRISTHHKFLRGLINGTDSHYRRILNDKVVAGKDRSLMKMTSSLTPGYYGARGLQLISENIMRKFTPLLKKRIVKDRLMSSRGFTGYVQAVLVAEVAVLLIMEDMNVDIDAARTILADSAAVGELLQEELKDVAGQRAEDSDGDELAH